MKKSLATLWTVMAIVGLVLSGCNKEAVGPEDEQNPAGVTNEAEAIKYLAANDEFVKNLEVTFEDRDVQPADYGSFGKIAAGITPLRFGRFINTVTTTVNVTVQPGDSIAVAAVNKDIVGIFKIRAINATGDTILIEKPFNDSSDRNIIFRRVDRHPRFFVRNWIPVATSLVAGGTVPDAGGQNAIQITQLQLTAGSHSLTVDDPLNFYLRYRWSRRFDGGRGDVPEVLGGDGVTLRVTLVSASPDTDKVLLRYGFNRAHRRRVPMQLVSETPNSDGTYTRVFETSRVRPIFVHMHNGFFHFGIDAMTRETLYDDTEPYAVSFWAFPYRVR